jgi:hypothetical protein
MQDSLNGVRSLLVMCYGCRHEVIVNADIYPSEFRCATSDGLHQVGHGGADVRPNWKEREN